MPGLRVKQLFGDAFEVFVEKVYKKIAKVGKRRRGMKSRLRSEDIFESVIRTDRKAGPNGFDRQWAK